MFMTEILLKRYPKKVDSQKKKQYTLEVGLEAYVKKVPKVLLEMKKVRLP